MKTIEKENKINYNVLNENVIVEIVIDNRKANFLKYSNSENFFKLDYNRMSKAIAIGSKIVLKTGLENQYNSSFNDENYIYYFDILNLRDNTFGIVQVVPINIEIGEIINERINMGNSTNTNESS